MSDAFPMPKTVEMPPATRGDYAPKRGLAAVAEAINQEPSPYRPPADYKPPKHQDAIKEAIRRLTFREMSNLCAEIFKAANGDAIAKGDLPNILDKFAHDETHKPA